MLKRIHRRHFDLAFFLGVVIFGTAYYLSIPQPLWTYSAPSQDPSQPADLTVLGFSDDDASLYTANDTKAYHGHLPCPMIYRWDSSNGKHLENYPLLVPDTDRSAIKEYEDNPEPAEFRLTLSNQPKYIQSLLHLTPHSRHTRLYQLEDGVCLDAPCLMYSNSESILHLNTSPETGHHLALITIHAYYGRAYVTDLATGGKLHTFQIPRQHYFKGLTTPDHQFLVFVLMPTGMLKPQMHLEVYRIHTWEKLGQFPLPTGAFQQLSFMDDTHWVVRSTISAANQNDTREQLQFFHFNPSNNSLTSIPEHPLHLKEFSNHDHGVIQGNYFYTNSTGVPLSFYFPFLAQVEGWLKRIGINTKRSSKTNVRVYDLHTGQLTRQLSGLPESNYTLSRQAHYVTNIQKIKDANNREQATLSVYAVPHYLWDQTLSRLQWLSWFLILPWPLRYVIARHNKDHARDVLTSTT